MSISKTIGSNIRKLMDENNLSLRQLAEKIGVSHPTLSKYVDGSQPIDSEKLMLIADVFNKRFDYFFKTNNKKMKFLFRADKADKNIKNIDISFLEEIVLNYIDIVDKRDYNVIPQSYIIDKSNKNKLYNDIEKIALEERVKLGLEHVIPNNYYDIIQRSGVNVIVRDFNNDDYFGASSYSSEAGSFIIINNSKKISEERKIFSLIHEYAHLLFDSKQYSNDEYNAFYTSGKNNINEKIANKFAGYFLMPRNMVNDLIKKIPNISNFQLKKHFKVSIQTVYVMLREYKLISKEEYSEFWRIININNYKKSEPLPMETIKIEDKNTKLFNMLKEKYRKEEISISKISEVLGTDILTSRQIIKEWESNSVGNISYR